MQRQGPVNTDNLHAYSDKPFHCLFGLLYLAAIALLEGSQIRQEGFGDIFMMSSTLKYLSLLHIQQR